MSERFLRNLFFAGSALFLVVLAAMTLDSLSKVASARTPALTDDVVAGKRLWQARNCNDCHTILGIGGYFAPDMTKVAARRDAAWLTGFLLDPAATKPGTTMPSQRLTRREAEMLVAFLAWTNRIDTNGWPPVPRLGVSASGAAALLADQKGCRGCHRIAGSGEAGPGPDLSAVGGRLSATQIRGWLEAPDAIKPGTAMPPFEGTPSERDALIAWLASLK